LLLGLLAAPAGTAQRVTTRPFLGLALSAALAIAATWLGLFLSYVLPGVPPSFAILAVATGGFATAIAVTSWRSDTHSEANMRPESDLGCPVL
jgi:zinc/manganese transport system permease protein